MFWKNISVYKFVWISIDINYHQILGFIMNNEIKFRVIVPNNCVIKNHFFAKVFLSLGEYWRPWSDLFLSVDALNGWLDSKEGLEKWWRIVEDEEKAEKRKIKKKKKFLFTSYNINYVLPLNFNWYYSMPHKVIIVFGYCDQKHEVWKLQSKGNPRYLRS